MTLAESVILSVENKSIAINIDAARRAVIAEIERRKAEDGQ